MSGVRVSYRPPFPLYNLGVAQPGSATGLGPVGREFESLHRDHIFFEQFAICINKIAYALIAQLVEQLICNHQVRGSSPCEGTITSF